MWMMYLSLWRNDCLWCLVKGCYFLFFFSILGVVFVVCGGIILLFVIWFMVILKVRMRNLRKVGSLVVVFGGGCFIVDVVFN